MLQLLKNRHFRYLLIANLISMLGSEISRIGLLLYLFHDTHSLAALVILISLQNLPGAAIAPLAGAIVDRVSKRKVMVASDLVRLACLLFILVWPTHATLYCMIAVHSVASIFFSPAKSAALPLIVGREELVKANGLDQSIANIVLICGPVIGAEMFIQLGVKATLSIDALTFLASAFFLWRIKLSEAVTVRSRRPLADIVDGCRYLVKHPTALHLVALFFASLLCVGLWLPLAPFFIRDFLGAPDRLLGLQIAVFGIGAAAGALLAPAVVARLGKGLTLFIALLSESLLLILYSLISAPNISVTLCSLWGGVVAAIVVPYYSIIQQSVDGNYLGRVSSVIKQSESLAIFLAMLLVVLLARSMTADHILSAAGLVYCALVTVIMTTKGGRLLLRTN